MPSTAMPPTSLTARIHELVSACFTGIWLETCEPEEACREISSLCQTQSWRLASTQQDNPASFFKVPTCRNRSQSSVSLRI